MTELTEALHQPVLLAAIVLAGLQAGTFFTWATGIMPGLARTTDRAFVETMRQVNLAIVNPVFLASFLGAPLLAVAAVVTGTDGGRPWAAAGAVLAIGTVVVTAVGNIPLNNALEAAAQEAERHDPDVVRDAFEGRWVRWNLVRTLTSAAAFASLTWAALQH